MTCCVTNGLAFELPLSRAEVGVDAASQAKGLPPPALLFERAELRPDANGLLSALGLKSESAAPWTSPFGVVLQQDVTREWSCNRM